jgi:tetratricopeptide (TPR) repeat protein
MELTTKDLELINAYYEGTLVDQNQKRDLELHLEKDAAFKKAVLEWRVKNAAFEAIRQQNRRDFLLEVDSTMPPIQLPQPTISYLRPLRIVAAAVLIGFVAWSVLPLFSTKKPEYAAYFKPFPADEQRKGSEGERIRAKAFEQYDKANYCDAAENFGKAFELQHDTLLQFYHGISAVGCGDFAKAQPILESLQISQMVPKEHLPYFLGLTYANTGQNDRAKAAFEKAITTSVRFKQDAYDALQHLNQKK